MHLTIWVSDHSSPLKKIIIYRAIPGSRVASVVIYDFVTKKKKRIKKKTSQITSGCRVLFFLFSSHSNKTKKRVSGIEHVTRLTSAGKTSGEKNISVRNPFHKSRSEKLCIPFGCQKDELNQNKSKRLQICLHAGFALVFVAFPSFCSEGEPKRADPFLPHCVSHVEILRLKKKKKKKRINAHEAINRCGKSPRRWRRPWATHGWRKIPPHALTFT